ncbi:MAG: hypothetical protein ISR57_08975 [Bacteroidales bacterium]|nr:hypothetical protein [Bacteroidales bacterium]
MLKRRKKEQSGEQTQPKPLRLWPGLIIVILLLLVRYGLPVVGTGELVIMISVFGGILCWLAIVVWWAFFSRARLIERWSAVVLMIVALVGASFIIDESIGTGLQGMMFFLYAIPVLSIAFVAWAVVTRHLAGKLRFISMAATILLVCAAWALFRSDGITGNAGANFSWRCWPPWNTNTQ